MPVFFALFMLIHYLSPSGRTFIVPGQKENRSKIHMVKVRDQHALVNKDM